MKTLKLTMIIAILSFAMISYAGVDPKPVSKKVVKISLARALATPGLVNAMSMQLTLCSLEVEHNGIIYVGIIEYHKVVYKIYGKHKDWIRFFFNSQKKDEGVTKQALRTFGK